MESKTKLVRILKKYQAIKTELNSDTMAEYHLAFSSRLEKDYKDINLCQSSKKMLLDNFIAGAEWSKNKLQNILKSK